MLSIGKLGTGRAAAEYYLARQAGCPAEYYTGSGERRGRWLGRGAAALGLSGDIAEEALRHLLAGRCPDGSTALVEPVLRADPRGRLPAGPLAAHVHHLAALRGIPAGELLDDEQGEALGRVLRAVARDHQSSGPSRATVRADIAASICRALGLDPRQVYAKRPGAYDAALAHAGERVDVRIAGFDVTLSAPKSVSVLYGLADPAVAEQVRIAHGRAVAAAIAYLEAEAGSGLRGHHGDGHTARAVASSGLVAAAFQHRANRCGDPQLHTHVVVANLVLGVDGRVSALDSRSLYAAGKTAGYLYQAVLRHELTTALRVQWTPVRRGVGEVAGIPAGLCRVFSKRRQQIEALLAGTGRTDAKAAQEATLATRPAKTRSVTGGAEVTLRERWAAEARAHGHDPAVVTDVRHRAGPPRPLDPVELSDLVAGLARPDGLTLHRSTFDRRDVLRSVCAALPGGASPAQLEVYTAAAVVDGAVVPLQGEIRPGASEAGRCYSTVELLAVETAALVGARARRGAGVGLVESDQVVRALSGAPTLNTAQADMVRGLLTSGAGVDVVVGHAGAGKTTALRAAAAGWRAAGYRVIGCALAASAARQLAVGAGIPATSITRLLTDAALTDPDTGQPTGLGPRAVLILDETGMVGTRTLARLLDLAARDGAKLVAVGDPAQLPEIDAGGLFAALARDLGAAALTDNLRQAQAWEHLALRQLRAGKAGDALTAYTAHGRVHTAESAIELREQVIADWWAARVGAPNSAVLMLAVTRADTAALNAAARAHMHVAGLLTGPAVTVHAAGLGERVFAAGDHVIVQRNTYDRGALNGTRAVISTVDPNSGDLTLVDDHGHTIALDARHLLEGRLDHGYATTCHKAQGLTLDVALVYGTDALSREAGYVALSRGRRANHLYATSSDLHRHLERTADHDLDDAPNDRADQAPTGAHVALLRCLRRSTRQRLARQHAHTR